MSTYFCRSDEESAEQSCRRISDRIHDLWFDLDDLVVEPGLSRMALPLTDDDFGPADSILQIKGVSRVSIEDTERIGRYDIQDLEYVPRTNELRIRGNIPILITIKLQSSWELWLDELNG